LKAVPDNQGLIGNTSKLQQRKELSCAAQWFASHTGKSEAYQKQNSIK